MIDCAEGEGVVCRMAQNVRDELETVAASIAALVRQEGYRYRDIAVISNNPERYHAILPIVFSAYNIPYFIDLPKDARSCALSKGLLEAVALAADEGGEWLRYIKSPLLGLDAKLVGEVENYCYVWSVDEKQWLEPFVNHPDGLTDPTDDGQPNDEAAQRLIPIEQCRAGVVARFCACAAHFPEKRAWPCSGRLCLSLRHRRTAASCRFCFKLKAKRADGFFGRTIDAVGPNHAGAGPVCTASRRPYARWRADS